jgi:putative addiction module killer protein
MLEVRQTERYQAWFAALRDRQAKVRINVRIRRLQEGNPGPFRQLQGGALELKIDYGPGYPLYCTRRASELIILLVGGDKSSQSDDIALAQSMAKEI